jgi:hypothetical protein
VHREDHATAPHFEDEEVSDDGTSDGEVEDDALVLGGGNNESAIKPYGKSSDEWSNDGRALARLPSIPVLPMPELTLPRVAQMLLAVALNISDRLQGSMARS